MAPWENSGAKHSYNRPNKRRFDEIRYTIEALRYELFLNDIVLKTEVEKRVYSNFDRELMEAELYKQRLAALTEASRSQIWRVQSGTLTSPSDDFHLDYDSWNSKRKKPNYNEEKPCDYLSQYAPTNNYSQPPTNNWTGYNQTNNNYYNCNYNQPRNRNRKRKNKGPPVSMNRVKINNPVTKPTTNSATSNTAVKSSSAPVRNTVATNPSTTTAKTVATATKTNATAKPIVSTAKPNASVKPTVSNVQAVRPMSDVKPIPTIISAPTPRQIGPTPRPIAPLRPLKQETLDMIKANESRNVPSLFSLDMSSIRLQFAASDRIFIKSENYPLEQLLSSNGTVSVKTENPDSMVDDLEDHI